MQLLCGRYMAAGKHIGKVLVQIRPEEDSEVVVPAPWLMQVHPRYYCETSYSYIIAGTETVCVCIIIEGGWIFVVGRVTGQSGV
jgi:hypothetical protein